MNSEERKQLIGKRVDIIDKESIWYGHWGFIKLYDGNVYHIAGGSISSDDGITPIFDRNQFMVRRTKNENK